MEPIRTIAELYVYPVKSCRGIRQEEAVLGPRGLQYDRQWMVTRPDGTFLTQRELPKLACVVPKIEPAGLVLSWDSNLSPILIPTDRWETGTRAPVFVWKDTVEAVDQGYEAAVWLSDFLKTPARLAYMPNDVIRPSRRMAEGERNRVGFADAYPLLFASVESMRELNKFLDRKIGIGRFRPNVVVTGCLVPYEEDTWLEFRARSQETSIPFRGVKPCVRGVIVTTHQCTGERQETEPLRVLSQTHHDHKQPLFGMNVNSLSEGTLHVGDLIDVTRFGPRPPT